MTEASKQVPPVPDTFPLLRGDLGGQSVEKLASHPWARWFLSVREKVNALNEALISLGAFIGDGGVGFPVYDGTIWVSRTIAGTAGRINVTNGSGVSGNPTIDLITTGVTAGAYTNVNLTVDVYGRITVIASGGGGVSDGDKGDIVVSVGGTVWTIDAGVVTLAKMADVATGTVFYRKTAGTGAPEVQTLGTLKTDLGLNLVENTALSTWAGSVNLVTVGTITTGTWQGTVIGPAYLGTGTRDGTKFLRDDGVWTTVPGGGGSGITRSVVSVAVNTTAGATALVDYVYFVSGTTTLTLPTAVGNTNRYAVQNVGAGVVSLGTTSSQTIHGSSAPINIAIGDSLDLISDGANWRIV